MLATSIFIFCCDVFNPLPKKPWFLRVCGTSLLKTLWKRRNCSFSHSVFNHFRELSAIFIKFDIVVCKLFQFGRVQNLSFKELKPEKNIAVFQVTQLTLRNGRRPKNFLIDIYFRVSNHLEMYVNRVDL